MYVLREGGNSRVDEDYIFVGNAEVSYEDLAQYGPTYAERLAALAVLGTDVYYQDYHIGVSMVEGLVGDTRTGKAWVAKHSGRSYLTSSIVHDTHRGISTLEIPEAAKKKLIKRGLEAISTLSGHTILGGFGIELPTDLELIDFGKVFNGTPDEQAAEQAKQKRWQVIADELRQTLEIA